MENGNSTMGVKAVINTTYNAPPQTNIWWLSLPYNSMYKKASDIVRDLEGGNGISSPSVKIGLVGLWTPSFQAAKAYVYDSAFGEWWGDDFAIAPGSGICVDVKAPFSWVMNGTDTTSQLSFTVNPIKTNNWLLSIPFTSRYITASDIVRAIEGGDGITSPSTKIDAVGKWNHGGQAVNVYYYDIGFCDWEGYDVTFNPGDGIYLVIISNFTWTPQLITPEIP
ncbi:MAG: hypothetical protein HZB92_05775 [Euryarchaeota archaeon]|nr:hypothetical protein [Euryarchaeota archaeon]